MKNRGITLVALVITIIILLILAGITISQLTGSGLFENARLAEKKSENAQEKEEETLADYKNKISEYVNGSRYTDAEIDSKMKWKYLGDMSGDDNSIILPSDFEELYVVVFWTELYYTGTTIPKFALKDQLNFREGYGSLDRYQFYELIYTQEDNKLKTGTCYNAHTKIIPEVEVYYK